MWKRSFVLLLLIACRSKDAEIIDTSAVAETGSPTIDDDADGYSADEDCDNANSVVNPVQRRSATASTTTAMATSTKT